MDADTLRASLAPNIPPDSVAWWPLGVGWWALIVVVLFTLTGALARYSWHTPWWRWPAVKRAQRMYLMELNNLLTIAQAGTHQTADPATASVFNRAVSQWLRRLMRDGLGVPPTLPPQAFHQECTVRSPAPLPDQLPQLLQRVYSPTPAYELLLEQREDLTQLCRTCLNLHSPGPG